MRILRILTILVLSALYSMTTHAASADSSVVIASDDRYCTTCHGVQGAGNIAIQAPRLAGMEDWYLKRQLENFRSGIRGIHPEDIQGIEMQAMASKLTDASISDIINWVGSWDSLPAEITVEGDVKLGRTAYQSCAACHGTNGEGNKALNAPALAGQNDWYLISQIKNYQRGKRGSHREDVLGFPMIAMAKSLGDEQAIINVVSYINTLQK